MIHFLKSYMLPIAMLLGTIFSSFFAQFIYLTPFLIFTMLFFTYCNVSITQIKFSKFHLYLLCIQIVGSLLVYGVVSLYNPIVAQGAMVCMLAPTATAAAVITGMLGGNVASLTAYSLLSNIGVATCAPIIFSLISDKQDTSLVISTLQIMREVSPMLIAPIALVLLIQRLSPKIYFAIQKRHSLSFYLWSFALMVVVGKTVIFIKQQSISNYSIEISIAVISFLICILQFVVGRIVGAKNNQTVVGGQGLFQKNTILAIWMAQSYLDPISSIGPGAYVLWQNMVNAYQIWQKQREEKCTLKY